jgi:serine/threonine-protein kinase
MLIADGRFKILDFGLARHAAPLLDSASTITAGVAADAGTAAGTILGTVGYMSPEQAAGQSADARSDQFSFGAVVYELLSGRRAFDRPTAVETMSAIIRDEPLPLGSMRPDVSSGFQRVVTRCLEKSPSQRYESTRELAAALDALTPDATAAEASAAIAAQPPAASVRQSWRWKAALVAGAVVVGAAIAFAPLWRSPGEVATPAAISSVAVLPFANPADDPEIEYLRDGLTDSLIDHLSRARALKVMARATVMRFRDEEDPRQAAKALGVGAVVTGAVSRRNNQIVISAELVDGATGERLWGQTFDRPVADLMRVQDSIVASIADGLRLRLSGEEKARLGGFATNDPEAYEMFLKGRFLMQSDTEEGDLEALKLFEAATRKDPRFIDAHLATSSIWARRAGGGYESPREAAVHAEAALEKARAIDPNHLALRVASAHQRFIATRDWAAAERDYRALMDNPDLFKSIQYHPITLFFVARGRPDEAVALMERALVGDPGNLESRVMLGNFLLQAGRLDEAMRVYEAIAAEVPDDSRPLFGIADVHKRRGDYARAGDARRKAYELGGREPAARAFTGVATEAEFARAEIAVARMELRESEEAAKHRYVAPLDIARLHAQIGNREQALAGLESSLDEPDVGLVLLKVDQAWDSVRDDPRFAAVVKKLGIP